MKKRVIVFSILFLFCWIAFSILKTDNTAEYVFKDDETRIKEALVEKKTESVFCSVTAPSLCYLYRCSSGYIYSQNTPAPGSNPLRCTDGTIVEFVQEVTSD